MATILKWALRTIIFLAVSVALGFGIFYLFQNTGLVGSGFRGGGDFRPRDGQQFNNGQFAGNNPQFQPGSQPRDFGREGGEGGGAFGVIGGLMGIFGRLVLFTVVTVIVVVITKLLPKQSGSSSA